MFHYFSQDLHESHILLTTKFKIMDKILDDYKMDEQEVEPLLVYASNNKRFGTYLIDSTAVIMISAFFIWPIFGSWLEGFTSDTLGLYSYLYILFMFYYCLFETFSNGKTLGKMAMGTKALNEDGSEMDAGRVFIRSLCRLIPFDHLSFVFDGNWHDKFSKTMVIDIKLSRENGARI
jgi:uncharacterized RDD family membrane protein YckC